MSQVTTHKCDRCGDSRTGELRELHPWQLWEIQLSVYSVPRYGHSSPNIVPGTVQWCRKCCGEFQLLGRPTVAKGEESVPVVTFEEQLREFIRTEIEAHNAHP